MKPEFLNDAVRAGNGGDNSKWTEWVVEGLGELVSGLLELLLEALL